MIYLLWGVMFLVTYVIGRAGLVVISGKKFSGYDNVDCFLTGLMLCICMGEAAHLMALLLGKSFAWCVKTLEVLSIVAAALSVLVCLYERRKKKRLVARLYDGVKFDRTAYYMGFVTAVIIVIQFVMIQVNEHVYLNGDMTVETVNTFLREDGIYTVNPLNGVAYTEGMPFRVKILCLPTLYGFLVKTFQLSTIQVVWQGMPAFVLICAYMAYFSLGKLFFPTNLKRRAMFLTIVAFMLTVGDYMYGVDGFLLLQSGFRGVAIRALVLVPYAVCMTLRKKWMPVVLCIVAEACITWTLYGAGVCLFVAAGITITNVILNKTGLLQKPEKS